MDADMFSSEYTTTSVCHKELKNYLKEEIKISGSWTRQEKHRQGKN